MSILRDRLGAFMGLTHTTADMKDLLEQGLNIVAALTLSYEKKATFTDATKPSFSSIEGSTLASVAK